MEGDSTSSSIFPFHEDEFPIQNYPDLSIWDVGFDQISYDDHLQKVEGEINYEKNELLNNLQKIGEGEGGENQETKKKMQHREIERQRRKEMTDLYASLRSVLPSKSLKGMRSASDQIHEATKYIRSMQSKVRQLQKKKENMKKSQENEKLGLLMRERGSSSRSSPTTVAVQQCSGGVQVLIGCDFAADGKSLSLSRILRLLLEQGLNVVECNCTKYHGRLNYMIQSEVVGCSSIDLQMLQGKLDLAINLHTT